MKNNPLAPTPTLDDIDNVAASFGHCTGNGHSKDGQTRNVECGESALIHRHHMEGALYNFSCFGFSSSSASLLFTKQQLHSINLAIVSSYMQWRRSVPGLNSSFCMTTQKQLGDGCGLAFTSTGVSLHMQSIVLVL